MPLPFRIPSWRAWALIAPLAAVACTGSASYDEPGGDTTSAGGAFPTGQGGSTGAGGRFGQGGGFGTGGGGGAPGASGSGGGMTNPCGDGVKDGMEKCDGADLGGATCADAIGAPGSSGTLLCFANCSFDTHACALPPSGGGGAGGAASVCGDGVKEGSERCDGADLAGATCASATGVATSTGTLACFTNCTFDESQCSLGMTGGGGATGGAGATGAGGASGAMSSPFSTCGDGVKNGGELCDGTDFGGATCATALGDASSTGVLHCNANCTLDASQCATPTSLGGTSTAPVCGNGIKEGTEACDKSDLGLVTCASALGLPGSTGSVTCFGNCTLDTSKCVAAAQGAGGGTGSGGANGGGGAGGAVACMPIMCQNHVYECGDCLDNDGDGLIDMADPDCLGPCDNNESGFSTNIPGGNNAPCKQDCYFDQDSGTGDDGCSWDHKCDPHEVAPSYDPEGTSCTYDPNAKIPGGGGTCSQLYNQQSDMCHSFCGPLTPNGCDCFGCCELPAGAGNYVWLGSTDANGAASCDLAHVADPTKCRRCEPVQGCLKPCQHCELCLGKTTLPADCLPAQNGTCGDGTKDGTEHCDGMDLGGATCASVTGNPQSTGALSCFGNCTVNASACTSATAPFCGDLVREGSEQCDGADLSGATCASITGNTSAIGTLSCYKNCTLNASGCFVPNGGGTGAGGGTSTGAQVCGDGAREGTEQCDGADFGGATCATVTGNPNSVGALTCASNCTINSSGCSLPTATTPICGNGTREGTEQCDGQDLGGATCASVTGDPNSTGTLLCFTNCTFNTSGCTVPVGSMTSSCGGQLCAAGSQPCGLACQPACPTGEFCLTGCCIAAPH